MAKLSLLFVALAFAGVSARCADNCNRNGICGPNDKCTCFKGFTGTSCGDRVCAYGNAWIGQHSSYVECSNKGSCDRKSGLCKCQDGFEGKSCQRMVCPNEQCGGHGQCLTQNYFYTNADSWDQKMIQGCNCDPGYGGNGCEERLCPKGDDPMTEEDSAPNQIQKIVISKSSALASSDGEVYLSFTDKHNGATYKTWVMSTHEVTAIAIEEALEALPNKVCPDVTVTSVATGSGEQSAFTVEFIDKYNSGAQNTIVVATGGCTDNGCDRIFTAPPSGTTFAVTVLTSAGSGAENAVCSNRGSCDTETGMCLCDDGFKGQACDEQTNYQ